MFDALIGSVWAWIGGGAAVVIGALAVAYFVRPLRPYALMVAAAAIAAAGFAARVASAAKRQKQREWDDAERKSVERGERARADAERDVAAGRVRDKFDRDDL
jgi:membrane protein implicated in regulation of membrane protease activity